MNFKNKYSLRMKTYLLYALTSLGIVIVGYLLAPNILNFPPHTEIIAFQKKVESLTHIQQYALMLVFFVFVTIISVTILYKDIFSLIEKTKLNKPINQIRDNCFKIPDKMMIIQIIAMFFMGLSTYVITPDTTLIAVAKLLIFYITMVSCGAVISTFFITEWLRQFVIWSYKQETDFSFNFTKVNYANNMLKKVLPLIIVIYIITTFFAYSLSMKEIGTRGYEYYKNEVSKINLNNLSLNEIIEELENISLWREKDSYFYSFGDEFINSKNEPISNFFVQYTKDFIDKTEGHTYDFFGVEQEGYATKITTIDGELIYVGFIYKTSNITLLLLTVFILIISVVVSILYLKLLLNSTSRDIKLILQKLTYISTGDLINYSENIPISTNSELGEIIATYNTIQDLNKNYVEQLNIAKEQADRANSAKTDFLSSMSHEIRTPLNAIVGFSQALAEECLNEQAQEEVNDIIMASNNLLEIVNGILDISKIEANKLEIVSIEYNINKLFKESITLAEAKLGSKPLEFRVNIDPNLPPVLYGDRLRVKQILLNLLTNAIKYTREGFFSLTVSSIVHNDVCRLIIAVEDSGIGIKPDDIDKLFSKFQRFELEKNATTEGTGLGLAITKSLVELMGGKIIVQSHYGEGSKFTVSIDQRIIPKTADDLQDEIDTDTSPFSALGQHILVVDDNKVNLKVANRLLRDYQVDVDLVSSGRECIDNILAGEKYDLILMDDMMPKMSGTEALKNLKKIVGFDTPVIALTANAITGMRERYLSLGFDDYIAKPIDRGHLNRILRKFLKENNDGFSYPRNLDLTQEIKLNIDEGVNNIKNAYFLEENGIEYKKGIELLGDLETYEMTLEDFYDEIPSRMDLINKYKDNNDMPNYAIYVHAMKSDAKYLGCTRLAELSLNHETESKAGNRDFVNEHYMELVDEANRILQVIKKYLGR